MNKLFYIDPTIKIDSFLSMFNYAVSNIKQGTKETSKYLDELFNYFISNIENNNIDPIEFNNEMLKSYYSISANLHDNLLQNNILNYLMAKSSRYIQKQLGITLK